jgi:integrase
MPKMLTVTGIEKLRARGARYEVGDLSGVRVVVHPSGRKAFVLRPRLYGKPIKITLDALPPDIAAARDEATPILRMVRAGQDPRTVAADQESARPITFKELADDYIKRYAKPRKRTWEEDQAQLERDVLPRWGQRTAASITRRDVLALLEAKAQTAPTRANRLLACIRKLFNWAVEVDLLQGSPAAGVKPPSRENSRDRILSDAELIAFWRATGRMGWPWGPYLRTLLLTIQREGEVAGMVRPELDLQAEAPLWTLAAVRTKAGRVHDVPLSPPVVDMLADAPEIVVDGTTGATSQLVFTRAGKAMVSFSHLKRELDKLMLAELRRAAKEAGSDPSKVEVEPWVLHDLRRTGASYMASRAVPVPVVAAILNHAPGSSQGITAVYNRYRYTAERRAALEAWANHVLDLVAPRASNVVAMRGAAG